MKLGFGMMRLPRVEGTNDIDLEHTKRMVDAFIEAGGKYFDTAYIYEGSEEATKASLCDRYPRESYYLADKLNGSDFAAKSEEDAKNEIRVSLERTGAGYIDFYLLHGIDEGNIGNFNRYGIWEYMRKLKTEGLIRPASCAVSARQPVRNICPSSACWQRSPIHWSNSAILLFPSAPDFRAFLHKYYKKMM